MLNYTPVLEETTVRATGFKVFRREVEIVLKAVAMISLGTLLVLPLAWGYRQRNEARAWREIACAYRLKQALSDGRLMTAADQRADPCERLSELGLQFAGRGN